MPQDIDRTALPAAPRRLDPEASFNALVDWVHDLARERNAPGMVVGISGTDSLLAFLACAKGYERLGKPDRVMGVHYGKPFPPTDRTPEQIAHILKISPAFNWVSRIVMPWLQTQAPAVKLITDDSFDTHNDHKRWAALFSASLDGADPRQPLDAQNTYWVVGTRNATENMLGTYSNLSMAASVQPLIHLWKSEILQICAHLNVPQIARDQSRQVDCDCGRFDLAADHIEEVDAILMERANQLSPAYLRDKLSPDIYKRLNDFVDEQIAYAAFKKKIPYTPSVNVAVHKI